MASSTASRAEPLTLADVLEALDQAGLPKRRRQELASAVRTTARAFQREPAAIEADPRLLAKRLAEVAPVAHGLSPGRWANVRSLLRAALALVREVSPGRHLQPLSSPWQALRERLLSRSLKTQLSRFLHFCSAARLPPAAVTIETFADFRSHLDRSLIKSSATTYRETVSAWNRAGRTVPGWPDLAIEVPSRRRNWTLPWSAFPVTLEADTGAWLDRLGRRDLLADRPFRPVQPATLKQRAWQIRAFASALVRQGRDPSSLRTLADIVSPDAVRMGLRFFLGF